MAVLQKKELSQEELCFGLIKLLMRKFEEKQLEWYVEDKSIETKTQCTDGSEKWEEYQFTGWEEIRIMFRPREGDSSDGCK